MLQRLRHVACAVRPAVVAEMLAARQCQAAWAVQGLRGLQTSTPAPAPAETSTLQAEAQRLARPKGRPSMPWTPTQELLKRKTYTKRMGHMLEVLERERVAQIMKERKIPSFGPGAVLELKLSVPENKRRTTVFKGMCIAMSNRASRTTFTLRNFIGPGALERTFPLFSPHIQDIKVLEERPVRRAKLYYLRKRVPREYRVA
ncbi:MRPL19 [Auxenochlorella protothecoides x Auxenochlorella symbiontica]|uniref:50S ribosomal protein L19, chloroplastic n=1 Tax=Auxenochlorella protothecoides TaxID=3075 RepID=A0A1D2A5V9_AUXPR